MCRCLDPYLSNSRLMLLGLAALSAVSLGMAFTAQYEFGLEPCTLCLIQRIPFVIIIALGLTGFILTKPFPRTTVPALSLMGLAFLSNSVIAFYHSGVERHWWKSFLEGCAVPDMTGDINDVLAAIEARTKAVPCDQIPWADPLLGLSMANYNVVFCFVLALLTICAARKSMHQA